MPHDVIMPALGMAQDTGILVSWLKRPGDAVVIGDALFEVETDKATMEVEAQHSGFLTNVDASEGAEVPVGRVIAVISETAEGAVAVQIEQNDGPPDGHAIIMPALGMAQDTGLLVNWLKQPGDIVGADEVLFEVETDKSTMEVLAGFDGFVAALLVQAGEEVPVGHDVAIISISKPSNPVQQSLSAAKQVRSKALQVVSASTELEESAALSKATASLPSARILASPKARRLAQERGLDLRYLEEAGHPQPFHVEDLAVLEELKRHTPMPASSMSIRRLTARVSSEQFSEFSEWAGTQLGNTKTGALIAGLAAGSFSQGQGDLVVAYHQFGTVQNFKNPQHFGLGNPVLEDLKTSPALLIYDLRHSPIISVENCLEGPPTVTLLSQDDDLTLTLECRTDQMSAEAAIYFLSEFAGRMKQPLRHLL